LTEQWSRESVRKRKKAARTAREQVGSGNAGWRVTDRFSLPRRSPLQFNATSTARLRLPICFHGDTPVRPADIEIDEPGTVAPGCWLTTLAACPRNSRRQPRRESEGDQMVCSKLHLKAIRRFAGGAGP